MVKKIGPKTRYWDIRGSAKHGWTTDWHMFLKPNWERIDGAKELSDLIEWDYAQPTPSEADLPAIEDEDLPEWVQAGEFQLPLDCIYLLLPVAPPPPRYLWARGPGHDLFA